MKKQILFILAVALSVTVIAQTSEKQWGIGAGAGAYGNYHLQQNGFVGGNFEMYLSKYLSPKLDLSFNAELGFWNTLWKNNQFIDYVNPIFNLSYKLTDEREKFRPYVFGGPGYLAYGSKSNQSGINFDLGVGAKYYASSNVALYGKVAFVKGVKNTDNLYRMTYGIEYDLGKAKDADMDGVSDLKDKCPKTPTGVKVDQKGCPVDTDRDKVADYLDDCPTVAGSTSLKGCPDKDKDGIADKDDSCPDVAGTIALKGCPDSDGDGIADKDDKCADTQKGWKVDASGCPLDQDKDGVADSEDDCPTVAGSKENKGCPVVVKEVKQIESKKEISADEITILNIKVTPISFVSGASYVTDYSKGVLGKLVKLMKSNPDYKVNVFGYADNKGSAEQNIRLSRERADAATKYLISQGISADRIIQQKAFGAAKPVATNDTPEGRLLNRRVEFEIFKMQ